MYVLRGLTNLNSWRRLCTLNVIKFEQSCYNYRFSTRAATHSQKEEKNQDDEEIDLNKPLQYSTSPAHSWRAKYTRLGSAKEPRLWYEPYVILGSLAVFMIYFTILREENDIDEIMKMSLYDRIEGLEEQQLRIALQYNLDNGLSTTDIVKRLNEIEAAKKETKAT